MPGLPHKLVSFRCALAVLASSRPTKRGKIIEGRTTGRPPCHSRLVGDFGDDRTSRRFQPYPNCHKPDFQVLRRLLVLWQAPALAAKAGRPWAVRSAPASAVRPSSAALAKWAGGCLPGWSDLSEPETSGRVSMDARGSQTCGLLFDATHCT